MEKGRRTLDVNHEMRELWAKNRVIFLAGTYFRWNGHDNDEGAQEDDVYEVVGLRS